MRLYILFFILIPTVVLTLIYYIFGSTVFQVVLTTLITMIIGGGIGLYFIIKKFIKPFGEKMGVFKKFKR
jgi:hypothetical protein